MGNGEVSKLVVVISFVFFGFALGSKPKRSKVPKMHHKSDDCYASVAVLVVLVFVQLFLTRTTRCLCCATSAYKSGAAHIFAIVAFVFSWLFFVVAVLSLIIATANPVNINGHSCEEVKSAVFAVGIAFTVLTMLMSILYSILISKASISAVPSGARGPADGGQGNPPSVGLATYA